MSWDAWSGLWFALKVLAVGAGFAAGSWVGMVLTPWIANRKLRSLTALLCGLLCGFAIWLAISRSGGGGGWGSGGFGLGGGAGTAPSTGRDATAATDRKKRDETPADHLRVRMLGGQRVRDQRFYLLDDGAVCNWSELLERLAALRQQAAGLQAIDIVIYQDSVDRDNPAVHDLVNWAKQNRVKITLSFPPEDAP
jgi:hypothetical protein